MVGFHDQRQSNAKQAATNTLMRVCIFSHPPALWNTAKTTWVLARINMPVTCLTPRSRSARRSTHTVLAVMCDTPWRLARGPHGRAPTLCDYESA